MWKKSVYVLFCLVCRYRVWSTYRIHSDSRPSESSFIWSDSSCVRCFSAHRGHSLQWFQQFLLSMGIIEEHVSWFVLDSAEGKGRSDAFQWQTIQAMDLWKAMDLWTPECASGCRAPTFSWQLCVYALLAWSCCNQEGHVAGVFYFAADVTELHPCCCLVNVCFWT